MKLGTKTSKLASSDIVALTRPCVYQFIRDGKVLYVGSSQNGIIRWADPGHHKTVIRKEADEICVLWFDDVATVRVVEGQLIRKYLPRSNWLRFARKNHAISKFPT